MFHRITVAVDLDLLPVSKDSVPTFLPPVIKFILDNITEVGIFRRNGSRAQVLKIDEAVSQHVPSIPEESTVFDVASFLKLWLLKLPEPLIPGRTVSMYYGTDMIASTNNILSNIPYRARKCVAIIFNLMQEIIEHSNQNQMTFQNLTTCLTLALFQQFKNYPPTFNFKAFFEIACGMLNEEATDFELNRNIDNESLKTPRVRMNRRMHSKTLRSNLGFIRKSEILASLPRDMWITV